MNAQATNLDAARAEIPAQQTRVTCDKCSNGLLRWGRISTAFWQGDDLVIVRNIPAMVCPHCGEQYFDDLTVVRLDQLRAQHFSGLPAIDQVLVPVHDFGGTG